MRIGVDIDDTTSKTNDSLIEAAYNYDKKFLKGRGFQDKNAYSFTEMFFWNVVDVDNFLNYVRKSNFYLKLEAMEDASKCINKLRSKGHKIIFITKRSTCLKSKWYTKRWLKKNGISYDKIVFGARDKGKVIEEEKIDLMIDDDIKNVKKALDLGRKAYLMDSKYNQDAKKIERVKSWKEIYIKIKEG